MALTLEDLQLDEVSAVDAPANKGARVVLLKRAGAGRGSGIMADESDERIGLVARLAKYLGVGRADEDGSLVIKATEDEGMDEKVQKQLKELGEKVEKLQTERDAAVAVGEARAAIAKAETPAAVDAVLAKSSEATRAAVAGAAAERKTALAKAEGDEASNAFREKLPKSLQKAFDDMDEKDRKDFMSRFGKAEGGTAPDAVAKVLDQVTKLNEQLGAKIAKLEGDAEVAQVRAELADLADVAKLNELVPRVARLRKADREAADAMVEQIRATAKQARAGALFKVHGRDGEAGNGADGKIEKAAKQHQAEHPGTSFEKAYSAVLAAQPELYTEHLAEQEA